MKRPFIELFNSNVTVSIHLFSNIIQSVRKIFTAKQSVLGLKTNIRIQNYINEILRIYLQLHYFDLLDFILIDLKRV